MENCHDVFFKNLIGMIGVATIFVVGFICGRFKK